MGGDGIVRAAADGVAYLACGRSGNLVVVDHGGGWETGFYHLTGIAVRDGQKVARGDALGKISEAHGCGGGAKGAHVHFSIYHFPNDIGTHTPAVWHLPTDDLGDIGQIIGGWIVQDGAKGGEGCLQRLSDGARQCEPSAQIANAGVMGNGTPVGPPPLQGGPAPPLQGGIPNPPLQGGTPPAGGGPPPPQHIFHVHNTCRDNSCGLEVQTAPRQRVR